MTWFLLRRLIAAVLTLWAIATLCFILTRAAPGSPFSSEKALHPEILKAYEAYYGLDRPVTEQYLRTIGGYLRGDLGPSMYYRNQSCNDIIWPGFGVSLRLGLLSVLVALAFGIPLGVLSSAFQNKWPDYLSMSTAILGICVPNFVLGPLVIMIFSFGLDWLPPAGWPERWSAWPEIRKLILPAVTLSLVHVAYLSRLTRAGMLDVMNKDFIRTARAKGLKEIAVFLKHGLKNGVTPAVSYAGPMTAFIVTGSIVVEQIFAIPGLGQHFVKSALNRDMPLIMGCVLVYSFLVIVFNLVVDMLYGILDPRVRVH